jgi:hypothetical protein
MVIAICAGAVAEEYDPKLEVMFTAGFEDDQAGKLPEGWTPFSGPEGIEVSAERGHEGTQSLLVVDESDIRGVGLRSPQTPVKPGESYSASAWVFAAQGNSVSLYLEFWNADGERIQDGVHSFGSSGAGKWRKVIGSAIAPEDAVAATVLPYSHSANITRAWFDEVTLGKGVPTLYDRTPRPPAPVEHPCGMYDNEDIERAKQNIERHEWAKKRFESCVSSSQWWMELPDDEIATWIPEGTPFRVCDCPSCGAHWGVGPFTGAGEDSFKCKRCGTVFPNDDFPETGTEVFINPLGQKETNTFYQDDAGKKFRLSGFLRYARIGKLGRLGYLGRVYAIEGDVAYAEKVRKVLLRLAEVYPGYVPHDWHHIYRDYNNLQSGKLSGWKLHDAGTMMELCLAYDLTVPSGVYSDQDKSLIEEGVFREAARLITTTSPRGCCVNDGPFLMGAGAYLAKLLGEHDYMAWALEPPDGFFAFLEENFWRDGHWEDGSSSYEFMALSKFHVLPEIAQGYSDPPEYTGEDRYDSVDMLANPLMRKVYTAALNIMLPNRRMPAINDSTWNVGYPARFSEINYIWFPTNRNLALLSFAYGGKADESGDEFALFRRPPDLDLTGVEPLDLSRRSLVQPGLGQAILRNGEKPDSTMLVLDYGPVRGHAHPDKLNYLFYADGHEIAPDQGYLSARHHYTPWLSSTACHNEVLIDGEAQRKTGGELLSFITGDFAQSIRAKAPNVYRDIADLYERTLVMITPDGSPPYVLDVFRVSGGERHVMAFHADGEQFETPLAFAAWDGPVVSEGAGGKWLKDMRRAEAPDIFEATWYDEANPDRANLRLTVLDPEPAAVYHATAPGLRNRSTPWAERTMNVLFREQPGPESVFVSVAESVLGEPRLIIEPVKCSHPNVLGVAVQRGEATDYIFVGDEASTTEEVTCVEPEGLRFTGRQAVVTIEGGKVTFAQIVDGTSLTIGALNLTCDGPISGTIVAFDDEADTFTVDAALPEGDTLTGRQLLVAGRVDGAYEIARVETIARGSVVYLADEPIMRVAEGDDFTVPSVAELRR